MLQTLVFVFNGNGFAEVSARCLSHRLAAQQLIKHGDQRDPVGDARRWTARADFYQLADEIRHVSKGQPIGLMGFSAGRGLAMRLSGVPTLNVKAVMSYYGPPDLRDWLNYHKGISYYNYVTSRVHFDTRHHQSVKRTKPVNCLYRECVRA